MSQTLRPMSCDCLSVSLFVCSPVIAVAYIGFVTVQGLGVTMCMGSNLGKLMTSLFVAKEGRGKGGTVRL